MEELENRDNLDTEQEALQDVQEAPVTAEDAAGEETDAQEPETPQEAAESPETGTQEEAGEDQPTEQAETGGKPSLGSGMLGLGGTMTPAVITPNPTLLGANSGAAEAEQESDEEYETLLVNELDVVKLGRQGEHLTQQVLIDCTEWLSKLPGCTLLNPLSAEKTEDTGSSGLTLLEDGIRKPDDFRHEQYLLIEENGKRILFSGCSHRGILNIMHWYHPDVLIGGFHLFRHPIDASLASCADALNAYPGTYYTCHCTGTGQYSFLKERMEHLPGVVGTVCIQLFYRQLVPRRDVINREFMSRSKDEP